MKKSPTIKTPLRTKKVVLKKKYWFVRKTYGWGWTPASIEGWAVLILYLVCVILPFVAVDQRSHSGSDTLYGWSPYVLIATIALIAVCFCTGESPRWSWGKRK